MRPKRMLMGVAVIGCIAAGMAPGAYAQGTDNTGSQLNTRSGGQQQPAARGQHNARSGGQQQPSTRGELNARTGDQQSTMRQGRDAQISGQLNARANQTPSSGQTERRGGAYQARMNASMREGRGFAEARGMRGAERGVYARFSEGRYGRGERGMYSRAGVERGYAGYQRDFRGGRGLYVRARAEGRYGYRGERLAGGGSAVGVGATAGVAAADSGYRTQRLYAYAPGYSVDYAAAPSYAPGYFGFGGPYAGPYYGYAGPTAGIGIGPVGIGVGFGPAWGP